jgi:deazaflavin-dependent oxidoreductase (nitroreductase family)
MARTFGRTMQMPGVRWMFQAMPTPSVLILVHRGRKRGRVYKTPLSMLVEESDSGEIVVSSMWSRDADWYRNVVAGGLVEIHVRGEKWQVAWRELDESERRSAGDAFRDARPVYSRMILRMIAILNGFKGDPREAAIRNLPMLALRRVGS